MNRNKSGPPEIKNIRDKIDMIDEMILYLINKRLSCAKDIGKIKLKHMNQVLDNAREEMILKRLICMNQGPLEEKSLQHIFKEIIGICRSIQKS